MKRSRHARWTFHLLLAVGGIIAAVLCFQSVRTYLYIDSVIVPHQAEHEAQREAGVLGAAAHSARLDDPRQMSPLLRRIVESAGDRVMWMRVLNFESTVVAQAGDDPAPRRIPANWWERVQKHEPLGTPVQNTAEEMLCQSCSRYACRIWAPAMIGARPMSSKSVFQ